MLDFDYTILVQFANFLVLLFLLNMLLFKPILGALRKRRETVSALENRVENNREEAEGIGKAYEEGLKEGKLPVVAGRDAYLKEAHAASMKVIEEARQELTVELSKIKESVKKEAEKTLETLRAESDRLALEIAEKIVKRGI